MQLLKWFSLMKEVVMCNKNLRQKSTQGQQILSIRIADSAYTNIKVPEEEKMHDIFK